jgi:hypothetical protein
MADDAAAADERLLQRLNALKPSTVRLQRERYIAHVIRSLQTCRLIHSAQETARL